MAEKIQCAIYKFRSHYAEKVRKTYQEIRIDLNFLENKLSSGNYSKQNLIADEIDGYKMALYYRQGATKVKWKDFMKGVAAHDAPILDVGKSLKESFVLIIQHVESGDLFAVTGGSGHLSIQPYVDPDFGLDIVARLVQTSDRVLRATKEISMTGGVLGSVKFFRNAYNFFENQNFGNLYQELQASLSKKVLTETFGFPEDEISKGGLCVAKNSFLIKTSVDSASLIQVIKRCQLILLSSSVPITLNSISRLGRGMKQLINSLNEVVIRKAWNAIMGHGDQGEIEICHKDFDRYLTADYFQVSTPTKSGDETNPYPVPIRYFDDLRRHFMGIEGDLNLRLLERYISRTTITSYDQSEGTTTEGTLREHLFVEVQQNGFSYFFIDSQWYEIKDEFIANLNRHCSYYAKTERYKGSLEKWNFATDSEGKYNLSHLKTDGFQSRTLVFDKVTPENIEACDILQWNDERLYFIHVKRGFNKTVRELSSQILIAAKRLSADKIAGGEYFRSLYRTVRESGGHNDLKAQLDSVDESSFVDLIRSRRLSFVFAILNDRSTGTGLLENMEEFESNIAKFSLHSLIQEMRGMGVELLIHEIEPA